MMRDVQDPQPELGAIGIEDIWLNPKSRDDIPAILLGLQHLYADAGLRARLFALLEKELCPGVNLDVGRPGLEQPAAETVDRGAPVPASASRDGRDKTAILVVDDDPHALRQMRDALAAAGYAPVTAAAPGEVARLVETKHPALAALDLMLPGADGLELMRTLPALADLPVILVSAYGRGETVARALEAGAADYIVKPFSPAELVARVGVELNRHAAPGPFVLGDLIIDRANRRVTVAGRPVRLTAIEYKLLHTLSLDAGGTTTYEALQRRVWGDRGGANPETARNAIGKLRSKIGDDAGNRKYILSERGRGCRMSGPQDAKGRKWAGSLRPTGRRLLPVRRCDQADLAGLRRPQPNVGCPHGGYGTAAGCREHATDRGRASGCRA